MNQKLPAWAISPPQDDDNWFYGIGVGGDISSAKTQAMGDIAAKVRAEVTSSSQVKQKLKDSDSSISFEEVTSVLARDIDLSHISVKQTSIFNGQVWLLSALSKKEYYATKKVQLDELQADIESLKQRFKHMTVLQRLTIYDESVEKINKANALIIALTAINQENFDQAHKSNQVFKSQIEENKNNISIVVISDQSSQEFASLVLEQITQEKLKVGDASGANAYIHISSKSDQLIEKGAQEVRQYFKLLVLDDQQQIIQSNDFVGIGRSYDSANGAVSLAAKSASRQLKQKGLFSLFKN